MKTYGVYKLRKYWAIKVGGKTGRIIAKHETEEKARIEVQTLERLIIQSWLLKSPI